MLHMVSWDGKMTPKCHWNPYMWRCIRAVVKFLNCAVYFPDDNSEKYPGILYPGDMTVYRGALTKLERSFSHQDTQLKRLRDFPTRTRFETNSWCQRTCERDAGMPMSLVMFLLFVRGRLFYRPNWFSSLLLHMIFGVLIFDVLSLYGNKVDMIWYDLLRF